MWYLFETHLVAALRWQVAINREVIAMNLSRREFTSVLAAALTSGFPLQREAGAAQVNAAYNLPRTGNVHLLHLTDCHAQLLPSYFREPSVNLGVGGMRGQLPHLVGERDEVLLDY